MIKSLLQTQQKNPQSTTDIKVEQAMIELNDMKIKMVEQQPFRSSAYTNMNTTT
jgi:ureidoglycolate hydrolase